MVGSGYVVSGVQEYVIDPIVGTKKTYVVRHNGNLLGRMRSASGTGRIVNVGSYKYAMKLFSVQSAEGFIHHHKVQP